MVHCIYTSSHGFDWSVLIGLSSCEDSSLDSEDGYHSGSQNINHQQQSLISEDDSHLDDHIHVLYLDEQLTDTPGFKPFVIVHCTYQIAV